MCHIPFKCFKAFDDIFDVKPEKMHLNKTAKTRHEIKKH